MGDGDERTHAVEVFSGGVVVRDDDVVDEARLVAVDQIAEQSAVEQRELGLVLPRVDLTLPRAGAGDAIPRLLEPPPADGDGAVVMRQFRHPGRVGADHRLGIGVWRLSSRIVSTMCARRSRQSVAGSMVERASATGALLAPDGRGIHRSAE